MSNFNDGTPCAVPQASCLRRPVEAGRGACRVRRGYGRLPKFRAFSGLRAAALHACHALPRAFQPMRPFRAAVTIGTQPPGTHEHGASAVATPAFSLDHRLFLAQNAMVPFHDRVHPNSPPNDRMVSLICPAIITLDDPNIQAALAAAQNPGCSLRRQRVCWTAVSQLSAFGHHC